MAQMESVPITVSTLVDLVQAIFPPPTVRDFEICVLEELFAPFADEGCTCLLHVEPNEPSLRARIYGEMYSGAYDLVAHSLEEALVTLNHYKNYQLTIVRYLRPTTGNLRCYIDIVRREVVARDALSETQQNDLKEACARFHYTFSHEDSSLGDISHYQDEEEDE